MINKELARHDDKIMPFGKLKFVTQIDADLRSSAFICGNKASSI